MSKRVRKKDNPPRTVNTDSASSSSSMSSNCSEQTDAIPLPRPFMNILQNFIRIVWKEKVIVFYTTCNFGVLISR
ncbi:hypothetical protein C0J52_12625 [Blattella germanica]|nr:hypothetical protein C0J52_12625 [Blattella germanica]